MNNSDQIIVNSPVLVLVGPTAIGKTALALELAQRFDCEIVSVDSMQVYRYMDIGTAKPTPEERKRAPHHLIDIVDPDEQFDAALFVSHALSAIRKINGAGRIPLLTGGTGMYLKALLSGLFDLETVADGQVRQALARQLAEEGAQGLFERLRTIDPATAGRIHPNDTQRLLRAFEIHKVTGKTWSEHLRDQPDPPVMFNRLLHLGLTCDRRLLYERIEERTVQMMREGLVEEVEQLRKMGYRSNLASMQSIGYRHANNLIDGVWSWEESVRLLMRDTRRYAKRQLTWFSSDPAITWIDRDAADNAVALVDAWLKKLKAAGVE